VIAVKEKNSTPDTPIGGFMDHFLLFLVVFAVPENGS